MTLLSAFNWFLILSFAPIMKLLTKHNLTVICVIFAVVVTEYVAIVADAGMLIELLLGYMYFVDFNGMVKDIYKRIQRDIALAN